MLNNNFSPVLSQTVCLYLFLLAMESHSEITMHNLLSVTRRLFEFFNWNSCVKTCLIQVSLNVFMIFTSGLVRL